MLLPIGSRFTMKKPKIKIAKASQKSITQEDFLGVIFLFLLLVVEEILEGVFLPVPLRFVTSK